MGFFILFLFFVSCSNLHEQAFALSVSKNSNSTIQHSKIRGTTTRHLIKKQNSPTQNGGTNHATTKPKEINATSSIKWTDVNYYPNKTLNTPTKFSYRHQQQNNTTTRFQNATVSQSGSNVNKSLNSNLLQANKSIESKNTNSTREQKPPGTLFHDAIDLKSLNHSNLVNFTTSMKPLKTIATPLNITKSTNVFPSSSVPSMSRQQHTGAMENTKDTSEADLLTNDEQSNSNEQVEGSAEENKTIKTAAEERVEDDEENDVMLPPKKINKESSGDGAEDELSIEQAMLTSSIQTDAPNVISTDRYSKYKELGTTVRPYKETTTPQPTVRWFPLCCKDTDKPPFYFYNLHIFPPPCCSKDNIKLLPKCCLYFKDDKDIGKGMDEDYMYSVYA